MSITGTTEVRAGATWLDQVRPGWYARVTRPIHMASIRDCVAGQVFSDCGYQFSHSGYLYLAHHYGGAWVRQHGFSGGTPSWLWYREIARRKKRDRKAARRADRLSRRSGRRRHDLAA